MQCLIDWSISSAVRSGPPCRQVPTAISLIQGMDVTPDGFELICNSSCKLGVECSVLLGVNFADEIALKRFCEATVGFNPKAEPTGAQWLLSSCVFCFLAKAQVKK